MAGKPMSKDKMKAKKEVVVKAVKKKMPKSKKK